MIESGPFSLFQLVVAVQGQTTEVPNSVDTEEIIVPTEQEIVVEEGSGSETVDSEISITDSETATEDSESSESESGASDASGEDSSSTQAESNSEPTTETNAQAVETTTPEASEPESTCTAVGRFPHPTDCQKYNYCWDLVHPYVTFTCKDKLVFDQRLGRCENDWSVCPHLPKCVGDHQLLADPADEKSYFVCKNIGSPIVPAFTIHKTYCGKHYKFNADLLVCVIDLEEIAAEQEGGSESSEEEEKKKEKFKCAEVGIFPDLSDERNYYECSVKSAAKGTLKTKKRSCPKNFVFSLQDIICVPELGPVA